MSKEKEKSINLKTLRSKIKQLKDTDRDGTWSVKARELCGYAFTQMPKSKLYKIAAELPIDDMFMQDLYSSINKTGSEIMVRSGKDMLIIRAAEELAELSQALMKSLRGTGDDNDVKEEMADVDLIIHWLKQAYNINMDPIISKVEYLKSYRERSRLGLVENEEELKSFLIE